MTRYFILSEPLDLFAIALLLSLPLLLAPRHPHPPPLRSNLTPDPVSSYPDKMRVPALLLDDTLFPRYLSLSLGLWYRFLILLVLDSHRLSVSSVHLHPMASGNEVSYS